MTKDDRYYSFIYTRSSEKGFSVRRVEVSRKKFQFFACSVFIFFAASTAFIFQSVNPFNLVVQAKMATPAQKPEADEPPVTVPAPETAMAKKQIVKDFSDQLVRPGDGKGGPDSSFDLSQQSEDKEATIIEDLQRIESNPNWGGFAPSVWPHMGKINNEYGFRRNPFGGRKYEFHGGLDIGGDQGEQVLAPGAGTVIKAGYQGGYGNMIEIDHGNGITTRYGHLSKINVEMGQTIARGELLGAVGSTGRSTGPHLHFEVRYNDEPLNPRRFLPQEPAEFK